MNINLQIKVLISQTLVYSIRKLVVLLNFVDSKVTKYSLNHNHYFYNDLAPKDDQDKEIYINSLVWAIRNKRIKNLALTGSYGSGKSTILRTLEKQHPEFLYLNISLAAFGDSEEQKDIKYESIEKSVLQQMFYREKSSKLQHSRFEKIKNHKTYFLFFSAILALLWLFSVLWFLNNQQIIHLPALNDLRVSIYKSLNITWLNHILLFIFIGGVFFIIFKLLKTLLKMEVSKLDAKGGEIAKRQFNSEISFLNRHLDEILYFFEDTSYNVVVFEDLDRFKEHAEPILTKLREINILLNNSKQINRHIVFIYAIKDDMFKDDKTRTKFFDFIIPVIPIIDSSNSEKFLIEKFEDIPNISTSFLEDIALYIDDMRTLNNIYNEFVVYSDQIEVDSITNDKILSMVIYKNLYPEDFAKLSTQEAVLSSIFKNKERIVKNIIIQNNQKIEPIENQIISINKEHLKNLKELQTLYIDAIKQHFSNPSEIYIGSERVQISTLYESNNFEKLVKSSISQDRYGNGSIAFSIIENKVDSSTSYEERKENILILENNQIDELLGQIEKIKATNQKLPSLTVKEIIDEGYSDEIFAEQLKDNLLLKFLIKNGHIDDNYPLAISHFHGGSLSKDDINFILKIKAGTALDFTYPLTKIENVIKKLIDKFDDPNILNINLVNYLINQDKISELEKIIQQIKNKDQRALAFLDNFITTSLSAPQFIRLISKTWDLFAIFILKQSGFSSDKQKLYFDLIINYVDFDDLVKLDKGSIISSFLSHKLDYIIDSKLASDRKQRLLEILNIKFQNLLLYGGSSDLLTKIYQTNSYALRPNMIELMVRTFDKNGVDLANLQISNYTTIQQSSCIELQEYIDKSLNEYIENVFLVIDKNIHESEVIIIELLNNESINIELKKVIISRIETRINTISSLPVELWTNMVQNSKLEPVWDNLIKYYENNNVLDSAIIEFFNIERNYTSLSKHTLGRSDLIDEFENKLLRSNDISDDSYSSLVKCVVGSYDSLDISALSNRKINSLLENKLLNLSLDNFNFLKVKEKHIELIIQNIDTFIEDFATYPIDTVDIRMLLESDLISKQHKSKMIKCIDENLLDNDSKVAKLFYEIWMQNFSNEQLDFSFLSKLLNNLGLYQKSFELRIRLLNTQIKFLSKDEVASILTSLQDEYTEIVYPHVSFLPMKYYNEELLTNLQNMKYYVSTYTPQKKEYKINKKKT